MSRFLSTLIMFFIVYGLAGALERITPEPSDPANMVRIDNNFSRIDEQYETIEASILQLYTAEVVIAAGSASKTVSLEGVTSASTFVAIPKTAMAGTITLSITVPSQSITIPSQTISKPAQAILVPQQTVNITDSGGDTAAVVIPAQYITSDSQNISVPSQSISTVAQNINLPTEGAYSPIISVICGTNTITLTRDIALYTGEITVSLVGFK